MRKVIRNNAQMLKIVWKYQKWIFVIAALFCICDIISPLQDTYLPKLIIDRLAIATAFEDMLPLILLFMAASIYKVLVYPAYKNYFSPLAKTRISNAMNLEMLENTKKLDLSCYENEEFYNRYTRALNELDSRAYSVFESVVSFVRYALYLSVLSGVIVLLDPVLLLLGIGCAVVSFLFNKKIAGIEFEFQKGLTGDQRKCDYTKRILYVPEYAKETRFFRISDLLRVKFQKYGERKVTRYQENGRKITGLALTSELVTTFVLHGVVVAYLVWRIVNHLLTPGDFIALLLATSQFSSQLSGLGDQLNNFYKNALYVDNLNSILNYEPEIERRSGAKLPGDFSEIIFQNVSFSYMGSTAKALEKVSIRIRRGEKIAIVGQNGSGKSTLIKLLLRLYEPSSGEIILDGKPIQTYATEEYRKLFGVIFQDFHPLAFSVGENILLRELDEEGRAKVRKAMEKSGIREKIEALKLGMDTPITRELSKDGVMFSGGELQSIMLSRLFLEPYGILILDEPTSALDPYAEYELYQELADRKNREQTMIIISHRLPTTKWVDVIYYMEDGRIVEAGSHEELMERNGKYASLYRIQNGGR